MKLLSAAARGNSNIAFIKYWGNVDEDLRLPVNDSLSMNLSGVHTTTAVAFSEALTEDRLNINGRLASHEQTARASRVLDFVRKLAGIPLKADVQSKNNFPTGAGIASSASAFSALALAATAAAGVNLKEKELSAIARLGSGSACRSIPTGFVEWRRGDAHENSYATSIAPPEHWDIVDLIAIVDSAHKKTGSSEGHHLAPSSPFQTARIKDTPRRMGLCRQAILSRDFDLLAQIIEEDTLMMHAVMMTSQPSLIYWLPGTMSLITCVRDFREQGLPVAFTIDAGANVHVITRVGFADIIRFELRKNPFVQNIIEAVPGIGAQLVDGL